MLFGRKREGSERNVGSQSAFGDDRRWATIIRGPPRSREKDVSMWTVPSLQEGGQNADLDLHGMESLLCIPSRCIEELQENVCNKPAVDVGIVRHPM